MPSSRRFLPSASHQLRADAIGADHRQVNFTFGVRVQAALAGDGLGAGLEILMLKFWQIARANNQAHQTNQIGQGIAQTSGCPARRKAACRPCQNDEAYPPRRQAPVWRSSSLPAYRPLSRCPSQTACPALTQSAGRCRPSPAPASGNFSPSRKKIGKKCSDRLPRLRKKVNSMKPKLSASVLILKCC